MKWLCLIVTAACIHYCVALSQSPDWGKVEQIFGRKGSVSGSILKVTFPRSDLHVKIGEVAVEPGLALTSWVGFSPMEGATMMMGDLVLLESEVKPSMDALVAHGLEVTALHNHVLAEQPPVMYMHFGGMGDPVTLAEAIKDVLTKTGTPTGPPPLRPEPLSIPEWPGVDSIIGYKGNRNGRLLQFGIPRGDTIIENGMVISPAMGMAIAINIQSLGTTAATTGDFVLTAGEVNPVLKALTAHGIAVTALHSHMLDESPRLLFMHFWGVDDPRNLARGLRAALDKVNLARKR
ncbi:MAG TPA: DUF1259 domain-containing protein [Bacteroidota bacterium]|jgi:hypothetical protein